MTARMAAAYAGHDQVVRLLLDASEELGDNTGMTALMAASNQGHDYVVGLLRAAGT